MMAFSNEFGTSYFGGEREPLLQLHAIVAEVKFKNLIPERTFYKTQYRSRGKTMQLVLKEDSIVEMEAITDGQLIKIVGWVRREVSAARKMNDDNGEVPIRNEDTNEVLNLLCNANPPNPCAHSNAVSQPFSVNLHPIYKGNNPDKPVFELSRNDKDRSLNLFQLIIQLEFIDGSQSEKFVSPAFRLQTKPGIKQAPSPPRPKRPRSNSSSPDTVISVRNGVTDGSFENREGNITFNCSLPSARRKLNY
ncbi:uncharacterized protein LOC124454698 [Xenia sp. Carnegie-2017]|uniref:uncharacterized protein LOC124454698 n=1 Tax=Xenia sp. Carnegie-2017 TaxID=2897299 RepID=UPI001F03D9B2|nr:uncharacterized protein LOC124454698 [Xenia sp. Carnegie-2017]